MSLASAMLRARKSYFNRPSATLLLLGNCRRSRPTSHSVDRASPQPSTSRPPAAGLRQSRASGGRAPLPASLNKRAMPSANKARSLLHVGRGTTCWTGTRSYLAEHQGVASVLLAGLGGDFRLRLDCGQWLACGAAIVSPGVCTPEQLAIAISEYGRKRPLPCKGHVGTKDAAPERWAPLAWQRPIANCTSNKQAHGSSPLERVAWFETVSCCAHMASGRLVGRRHRATWRWVR
jgi:hypothetical protein